MLKYDQFLANQQVDGMLRKCVHNFKIVNGHSTQQRFSTFPKKKIVKAQEK